jgi:hypothetical protein
MEITQQLQLVQDKACILFTYVESQGEELERVIITVEQHLEGPVNDTIIQDFTEKEATTKRQVKVARANIKVFEEKFLRQE